jgi:hypothetical protein
MLCSGSRVVAWLPSPISRSPSVHLSCHAAVLFHFVCARRNKKRKLCLCLLNVIGFVKIIFLCVHKNWDPRCNDTFFVCVCVLIVVGEFAFVARNVFGGGFMQSAGNITALAIRTLTGSSVGALCRVTAATLSCQSLRPYVTTSHPTVNCLCASDAVVPFVQRNNRCWRILDVRMDETFAIRRRNYFF